MSIQGLSGFNVSQIRELMDQLQQLLGMQQSSNPLGAQGNGGCSGDDQAAFQQILNEIQQLTSQLQGMGLSGDGNSRDGRFNINISA